MPIERYNFNEVSEADLRELIDGGEKEGRTIDYKEKPYGNSDADKREFLKDVSSFANTQGGHLIIGMKESDGFPTAFTPLDQGLDQEITRLESLIQNGIEPKLVSVQIRQIAVQNGHTVVIRIPKSWNPPHRVKAQGVNRFYMRHSSGVFEPDVEELRMLFNQTSSLRERIEELRLERLRMISAKSIDVPLNLHGIDDSYLVLHIIPHNVFEDRDQVDVKAIQNYGPELEPLARTGSSWRYTFDGFMRLLTPDTQYGTLGYTLLFRSGMIEATQTSIFQTGDTRPHLSAHFERRLAEPLERYFSVLRNHGIRPPFEVCLTLYAVVGFLVTIPNPFEQPLTPFSQRQYRLPACLVENYGDRKTYMRDLRPAFDVLWNAGGAAGSPHYDNSGEWKY